MPPPETNARLRSAVHGPHDEARELRTALGAFATGVTIVTGLSSRGTPVGLTVNSFASVSLDPPLVLWSIRCASALAPFFERDAALAIHVLRADQEALARRFADPRVDRFEGVRWRIGLHGVPTLDDVLARFDCRTVASHEAGDHRLHMARVERHWRGEGAPLVFAAGEFRTLVPG
jgi:flavin reductase (DIM6/NTAB) family NADH-FMN oxidoreductase RutF